MTAQLHGLACPRCGAGIEARFPAHAGAPGVIGYGGARETPDDPPDWNLDMDALVYSCECPDGLRIPELMVYEADVLALAQDSDLEVIP